MSADFSRRQCLQLMAAAGFLSVLPQHSVYAKELKQAFVITNKTYTGEAETGRDVFVQSVNQSIKTSSLQISVNSFENLIGLSQLPENTLLIGLVSDAELILVESIVHDRRGFLQETARVDSANASIISRLATITAQAALDDSNDEYAYLDTVESGSLISFYAYL